MIREARPGDEEALFGLVERPCSLDPDPPVSVIPPRILRWPWERPRADGSPAT